MMKESPLCLYGNPNPSFTSMMSRNPLSINDGESISLASYILFHYPDPDLTLHWVPRFLTLVEQNVRSLCRKQLDFSSALKIEPCSVGNVTLQFTQQIHMSLLIRGFCSLE